MEYIKDKITENLQAQIVKSVGESLDYGGTAEYVGAFFDLIYQKAERAIEALKEDKTPGLAEQLDSLKYEIFSIALYGKEAARQGEAYEALARRIAVNR